VENDAVAPWLRLAAWHARRASAGCGGRLADEFESECLWVLFRAARLGRRTRPYLTAAFRRACSALARRERRRSRAGPLPAAPARAHAGFAAADDADERAAADLPGLLARLDPRSRDVIRLLYWEGLSVRAAGAVLGLTGSRVQQIHAAALARMRGATRV